MAPFTLLKTALRLLTLRSVDAGAITGTAASITTLASLSLGLWVLGDWAGNLPDPEFFPYGMPTLAWPVLAALLTAAALSAASRPVIGFARACVMLGIALPPLVALHFLAGTYLPHGVLQLALLALAMYAIVYGDRALKSMTGVRQPLALAAGILVAGTFLLVGRVTYVQPTLWTSGDDSEYDNEGMRWDDGEAVFFEQAARIDAAAAKLERPAAADTAVFFVGFAGFGDQRVFAEEIKLAAQVTGQRYDTAPRTLLLLNDRRSLDAEPLASVTGLRYALQKVAAKMQLDRDILFLALSSHGSEDPPQLSVSNGALPFRSLTGDVLAAALRDSGIKWRVIVISACHAGAFIEPLRDAHTIVLTAAAADRTSFGCSDDRDLTYFGEAFYRDSLPQAASLREAFAAATKIIAEREREEDITASNPQAWFGTDLERRLTVLERERRQGADATAAPAPRPRQ